MLAIYFENGYTDKIKKIVEFTVDDPCLQKDMDGRNIHFSNCRLVFFNGTVKEYNSKNDSNS